MAKQLNTMHGVTTNSGKGRAISDGKVCRMQSGLPRRANGYYLPILALIVGYLMHFGGSSALGAEQLHRASGAKSLNENVADALAVGVNGLLIPADTIVRAEGPIALPSGFALIGENPRTSRIAFQSMTNYNGFILEEARHNVFAKLVIDCSAIPPPPGVEHNGSSVVLLRNCAHVLLEQVTFLRAPRHALAGSCDGLTVRNCRFLDGGFLRINVSGDRQAVLYSLFRGGDWYALQPRGKGHLYLGNTFIDTGTGLQSKALANSLFAHNRYPQVREHGVWLTGPGARDNVFAYNEFRYTGYDRTHQEIKDWASAIQSWSGAHNLMVGNFGRNIAGYGINISGASGIDDDGAENVVSDNAFLYVYDPIVLVNNALNAVVRRNRLGPCNSLGLHIGVEVPGRVARGAPFAKVINNYCWGNSYEGARLDACFGILFQGNWILNSGGTGPSWGLGIVNRSARSTGFNLHWYNKIIGNTVADLHTNTTERTQRWALHIDDVEPDFEDSVREDLICWNRFYGSQEDNIHVSEAMAAKHTIEHNDLTGHNLEALKEAPPLADAGPSLVVGDGSQVVLTALGSRCFEGTDSQRFVYRWRQVRGPYVTLSGDHTPILEVTIPELTETTIYGFEVTVSRTDTGPSTQDWVYIGAYNDEWLPPSLATEQPVRKYAEANPLPGWQVLKAPGTAGWHFHSRGRAMEATLSGGAGFARLIAGTKIFCQQMAVELRADTGTVNSFPAGGSAGVIILNAPWLEEPADGFFVGLHRAPGEAQVRLKVIAIREFTKDVFGQAATPTPGVLYSVQIAPEGWTARVGVRRRGDTYKLLINDRQVAELTFDYCRPGPEPPLDGCWPTVVGYQLLMPRGAPSMRLVFDNLRIDNQ